MAGTPSRQAVTRDRSDSLFIRSQDPISFAVITPTTGHSVSIYSPGGSLIETTSSGFTVSTETVVFTKTWTASSYPIDDYYRAVFSIVHSGGTLYRELYFSVVRRKFISNLTADDILNRHPYLENQLPSGTTFEMFLQRAWERILQNLWIKCKVYPGNIFQPENFFQSHEYFALSEFFLSITFDADTRNEDVLKYKVYEKKGIESLEQNSSLVSLDLGEDGVQTPLNNRNLSGIRVVR